MQTITDPMEEPVIRSIRPKPLSLDAVDPAPVALSYDRRSDTLLVHLFGKGRESVSVQATPHLFLMTDPETEEVVGLQVEGFLARVVEDLPESVFLLDAADLRGISTEEVRAIRRRLLGRRPDLRNRFPPTQNEPERKLRAVVAFLDAEQRRWGGVSALAIG